MEGWKNGIVVVAAVEDLQALSSPVFDFSELFPPAVSAFLVNDDADIVLETRVPVEPVWPKRSTVLGPLLRAIEEKSPSAVWLVYRPNLFDDTALIAVADFLKKSGIVLLFYCLQGDPEAHVCEALAGQSALAWTSSLSIAQRSLPWEPIAYLPAWYGASEGDPSAPETTTHVVVLGGTTKAGEPHPLLEKLSQAGAGPLTVLTREHRLSATSARLPNCKVHSQVTKDLFEQELRSASHLFVTGEAPSIYASECVRSLSSRAIVFVETADALSAIPQSYLLPTHGVALKHLLSNLGKTRAREDSASSAYEFSRGYRLFDERLTMALTPPEDAQTGSTWASSRATDSTGPNGVPSRATRSARSLRVLMQNRDNTFTHRGGDTVLLERVTQGLRTLGITVDIDVSGSADPRDFDIVHLYNFALRDQTEEMARSAFERNTPYVVTTLYEDWPIFFNQMVEHFKALHAYVHHGQDPALWPVLARQAKTASPSGAWDNTWTAHHAEALLASGVNEEMALRRDYPQAKRVIRYAFGHEVSTVADDGSLFANHFGVRDFVLCVGRLETRKNQLMLLKALEDSALTVVLAAGGFTYQQLYEDTCRAFRRHGKTIITGRLEPEMLASAYRAARVHVLPSWFELPGLVTLEAAALGTPAVASDYGTIRDYLGPTGYYCSPDDPQSIARSVMHAYERGPAPGLKESMHRFTWEACSRRTLEIYEEVLSWDRSHVPPPSFATQAYSPSPPVAPQPDAHRTRPWQELCEEADTLLANDEALRGHALYEEAHKAAPSQVRPLRGLGSAALMTKDWKKAREHFQAALALEPNDVRAITGLASALAELGDREGAYGLLDTTLKREAFKPALPVFLTLSYLLGKLDRLEEVLRAFLAADPQNKDILYCLAGCLHREGKRQEAVVIATDFCRRWPDDPRGRELDQLLRTRN